MVLVFLRDWRSVIIVVLNIPFALCGALVGAVAHRADDQPHDAGRPGAGDRHPGRRGDRRDREHPREAGAAPTRSRWPSGRGTWTRPCRGCWRCSASWPSSSRRSSCRARRRPLFVPLSLAVGFAMVSSYLLSSTFVPVLSAWLLRRQHHPGQRARRGVRFFDRTRDALRAGLGRDRPRSAGSSLPAYLGRRPGHRPTASAAGSAWRSSREVDAGRFQLRIKARAGTADREDRADRRRTRSTPIREEVGRGRGRDLRRLRRR